VKSPKSQIEGLLGEKHQIFLCFFLYLCLGFNPLQAGKPRFVDITADVGIDFKHAGGIDKRVIPAVVGSGAAFADYDNDGDLDLYIVNSSTKHDTGTGNPRNALYQNNGNSTFTDVTNEAGVGNPVWGMGAAFADYDNDGDLDLYVANYKANAFFRNEGSGSFIKFSSKAGSIGHVGFGSAVAWGDYDNDGYLDLYVANYLDYGKLPRGDEVFFPYDWYGQSNVLLLNKGDGGFIDVTESARVGGGFHLTLGASFADYDSDGDLDIYLANDTNQNILYRNNSDGTFTNTNGTDERSHTGDIRGGMGITWGDYDNDGDLDLFVTNWLDENNVLYRNNSDGTFTDVSAQSGIFESGLGKTCWGTEFFDYDNDGDLDLFIACGHIDPATWESSSQSDIFLENNGNGTFTDISESVGIRSVPNGTGRGLAVGDYDNDGDLDLLVVNCGEGAVLFRNDGGNQNNWLKILTIGKTSNRNGIGARIELTAGKSRQIREVISGSSYLSQSSLEIEFGLGKASVVDQIRILWPSGSKQTLTDINVNQKLVITEPDN
jgi:hypothetical protein